MSIVGFREIHHRVEQVKGAGIDQTSLTCVDQNLCREVEVKYMGEPS